MRFSKSAKREAGQRNRLRAAAVRTTSRFAIVFRATTRSSTNACGGAAFSIFQPSRFSHVFRPYSAPH